MGMKICNKCGDQKLQTEYYKSKFTLDGLYVSCKSCHKKSCLPNNRKWMAKGKGVYGIFSGETCLYVGQSGRLNDRISGHKSTIKHNNGKYYNHKPLYDNLRRHNNIVFRILEETNNHKEQEPKWIEYMTPLYNIEHMY